MDPARATVHLSAPHSEPKRALFSWALYDWANSAFPTLIQTFIFAPYFTSLVVKDEAKGTAAWGNMLGLAAFIIALGGPFLGAIADQTGRRKPWIFAFTLLCMISAALLWLVKPSTDYVWLGLVLVALGTIGAEFAMVFYNAVLPQLSAPDRIGRWSGWGAALGYAGGLAALLAALYGLVRPNPSWLGLDRESSEHIRATFIMVAGWYALFSWPFFLFTPDAPATGKKLSLAAADGLRQLWRSLHEVRRYVNIVRFLIARMIYIDGLATMFSFGAIFAAGTFKMSTESVLAFGITLNVSAGLGAAVFARLDDRFGSKQTILAALAGLIISASCMLLSADVKLFWAFGAVLGLFVGPVQAASRSLLARLAPHELRNQMFGLYAFSGKATSFLGPLLVGWVTLATKNQRLGMATIIGLFLVGALLMLSVRNSESSTGPASA